MANIALRSSARSLRAGWNTETASWGGTVAKTLLLFGALIFAAAFGWNWTTHVATGPAMTGIIVSTILAFIVGMITIAKPEQSEFLATGYAVLEGFAIGGISAVFAAKYNGIVPVAAFATLVTTGVCIFMWSAKIIKVTDKFISIVVCATGAIALTYFADILLSMFGFPLPFLHGHGPITILVSVIVCIIAAANIIIDMEMIDRTVNSGAAKCMEWYGGFSVMLSVVWLYLEILRLVAALSSSDD